MLCNSLDFIGAAEREPCCLGSTRSPYPSAQACAIEQPLHWACHMTKAQNGRRKLLVISPCSTDVESDASFPLRRWEGSSQFHWSPTDSLKLGSQLVRCCPAMVCLVLNLYRSTKRSKTQIFRIARWNVRTMFPGLTDDLKFKQYMMLTR